ncbi:MAG: small basic protein [Candidatus Brocadiaceae bacterium]|nr:small basic protein [Candidatus Brocadiaceae bacterium]
MSVDKSLKTKGKLTRPRNVFTRVERISILKEEGRWSPADSVFGIPKVKTGKVKIRKKSAKKAEAEASAEKTAKK